eukprot:GHVU01166707.1.p1 GENE.GHVU01166707.1~~GHVU01166707.1.p1  ORF type:complete len:108 (-),score=9.04 GHVU01166707.1:157-480(-)
MVHDKRPRRHNNVSIPREQRGAANEIDTRQIVNRDTHQFSREAPQPNHNSPVDGEPSVDADRLQGSTHSKCDLCGHRVYPTITHRSIGLDKCLRPARGCEEKSRECE